MPVKGIHRYIRLFEHVVNPMEYVLHKKNRTKRALHFTTKPHAISFDVPESLYQVFKEIFMEDVYEINELVSLLPTQPVVIDIGANAGFFDIQLLSKLNTAKIFAFEPMPANVSMLHETMNRNAWMKNNMELIQAAVTGKNQDLLELYAEPAENNQVVASVFSGFNPNNTVKIKVPCISLTDIILNNQMDTVDLLKMDCEGSEYDILYHTPPELLMRINRMTLEVHDLDKEKNNIAGVNHFLQSLGYQTSYQPINSFCYAMTAVRRTSNTENEK